MLLGESTAFDGGGPAGGVAWLATSVSRRNKEKNANRKARKALEFTGIDALLSASGLPVETVELVFRILTARILPNNPLAFLSVTNIRIF